MGHTPRHAAIFLPCQLPPPTPTMPTMPPSPLHYCHAITYMPSSFHCLSGGDRAKRKTCAGEGACAKSATTFFLSPPCFRDEFFLLLLLLFLLPPTYIDIMCHVCVRAHKRVSYRLHTLSHGHSLFSFMPHGVMSLAHAWFFSFLPELTDR